jgi:mono/diheme cytochrome c family protein
MSRAKQVRGVVVALFALGLSACGRDSEPAKPAETGHSPTAAQSETPAPAVVVTAQDTNPAPPTGAPERPAAVPAPPASAPEATAAAAGYQVDCPPGAAAAEVCKVDKGTYVGWRTFAANCQVCHGGSGLGSTFAPNLLDRLNTRVDQARFDYVLENGYTGQVGAMPAWKAKRDVMGNAENLYHYLRARADGVLPPGRPQRMQP